MEKERLRNHLIGTWKLASAELRFVNGSTGPFPGIGPNGKGYLIYAADGYMCAQLMNPDRPLWKDVNNPSSSEKVNAFDGFSAYCGRYEVDEVHKVVYHHPELAWMPNWVGTSQPRPYILEGDLLTFSDVLKDEPGAARYVIVWRKVKPDR
jgi:Lipocalin-like domain